MAMLIRGVSGRVRPIPRATVISSQVMTILVTVKAKTVFLRLIKTSPFK